MSRSILVTGGLGFIGSHLCRHLLELAPDDALTVVDDLSGTRLDVSWLASRARVTLVDLRGFDPGDARFDEIYHLASPVGSLGILARHGRIALDILELAGVAARLAARGAPNGGAGGGTGGGPTRLLYLSSSEVYGRDGRHGESVELVVPARRGTRMEYALGKLGAEHALANASDDGGFELRTVRPFNVVGPWQSDALGFVVPTFMDAALAGTPLQVFGDGSQRRSFCDVSDLVRGLVAVQRTGREGQVYNVGHPDNVVTIDELAARVLRATGSASAVAHVDPVTVHGPRYLEAFDKIPDIDKVVADTGWRPTLGLDAILARLAGFHARPGRAELAEGSIARLRSTEGTAGVAAHGTDRPKAAGPVREARRDARAPAEAATS